MVTPKIVWLGLFPLENPSVGDHAQVVAVQKWFKTYFSDYQVVRFYRRTPPPEGLKDWNNLLQTVKPNDLIFIHSSGDFGTLFYWTGMVNRSWHDFRRKLITQFPNNMIIQLPVSVFYHNTMAGKATLLKDKQFYRDKGNVVLMCREPVSHQILADNLECKSMFVPDFVFYYNPVLRNRVRKGVLLILREDHETTFTREAKLNIRKIIGTVTPNVTAGDILLRVPSHTASVINSILDYFQSFNVVVTDRLHGMIFSVITKTPCVVLHDKIPHKSSGYAGLVSDSIHFVESVNEIPEAIRTVLSKPFQPVDLTSHFTSLKEKVF